MAGSRKRNFGVAFVAKQTKKYKKSKSSVRRKTLSVRPSKVPRIARSPGLNKNIITQSFDFDTGYGLDQSDWYIPEVPGVVTTGPTRHHVHSFFASLGRFPGFEEVMTKYEECQPVSITITARLSKNAFGKGKFYQNNDVSPAFLRLNQQRADNSFSTPDPADNGKGGGAMMSPACFNYAKVMCAVDYDGLRGLGYSTLGEYTSKANWDNCGNVSTTSINSGKPKVIAQYRPKPYVNYNIISQQDGPISPIVKAHPWYPYNMFIASNGASQAVQTRFGGVQVVVISTDAVGCGYNGLSQLIVGQEENVAPLLGVDFTYTLKCRFRGETRKELI